MNFFLIGLLLIVLGGLLSLLVSEKFKLVFMSLIMLIGGGSILVPALNVLITGELFKTDIYLPDPIGLTPIVIDPLSAFFILIITVISFLGTVYGIGYLKPYIEKGKSLSSHVLSLSILIVSLLLVVTVQNAISFLIVWEFMSLSSFLLVIFKDDKKSVLNIGINYLILMHISVLFIMAGFALLIQKSGGSLNFDSFKMVLSVYDTKFSNLIFFIFFIGFGLKAGFIPLHTWLPKAHPAAPAHISGILSGVMLKVGIYGILRVLFWIGIPTKEMAYFVIVMSTISAVLGVAYALVQPDLKKLLAYHSIENIGIIGIGVGVGMLGFVYHSPEIYFLGFAGGMLHIINHAIFKGLLFFCAGSLIQTQDIEKLGGLIKAMPYASTLFLIGSLAICGLPPLNGFISEFLIYLGMFKGLNLNSPIVLVIFTISIALLSFVGAMALMCFTKVFGIVFLGVPRSIEAENVKQDAPKVMLAVGSMLSIFIVIIGLLPQYAIKLVEKIVLQFSPSQDIVNVNLYMIQTEALLSKLSFYFLWLIILVIGIFLLRKLILYKRKEDKDTTWGCGYQGYDFKNITKTSPASRMQYNASSYVGQFMNVMKTFFTIKVKEHIASSNAFFPKHLSYESQVKDFFDSYIFKPITIFIRRKATRIFTFTRKWSVREYILFSLILLIFALLGIIIK
ncbi:MAG: proton-conducting transporter membrane subunit [Rickettsiales bacterium]|nr:proton-conducting transporter membrane subunit [Rickettsiales bacterium]